MGAAGSLRKKKPKENGPDVIDVMVLGSQGVGKTTLSLCFDTVTTKLSRIADCDWLGNAARVPGAKIYDCSRLVDKKSVNIRLMDLSDPIPASVCLQKDPPPLVGKMEAKMLKNGRVDETCYHATLVLFSLSDPQSLDFAIAVVKEVREIEGKGSSDNQELDKVGERDEGEVELQWDPAPIIMVGTKRDEKQAKGLNFKELHALIHSTPRLYFHKVSVPHRSALEVVRNAVRYSKFKPDDVKSWSTQTKKLLEDLEADSSDSESESVTVVEESEFSEVSGQGKISPPSQASS